MPEYRTEEDLKQTDGCYGVRIDLRECIKESPCYKNGGTLKGCLKSHDVPQECMGLWTTFYQCKRSMLDNRARFRGRKGY